MYKINLKVTSLYTSLQGLYCKIVYSYLNKKRGLRQKLTQPSSLTSKSLTEILTSCKSYTHKQPSHPTLLQYGATGCISPYGPNGSKNRF